MGVPGIVVVAPSECHDIAGMLSAAVDDDRPVFFIENKLMYGRPHRPPEDGFVDEFAVHTSEGPWPALTFSGNRFAGGEATLVTYGGMLPIALEAATKLILEEEIFTEVVCLGCLLPLDLEPVLESVARTGALVTVEEGTLTAASAPRSPRACRRRRGRSSAAPSGASPPATGSFRRPGRSRRRRCPGWTTSSLRSPACSSDARDRAHARGREQRVRVPLRVVVDDGAAVREGTVVCVVETSKASVEIEAPGDGMLVQLVPAETEVELGSTIAVVAADETRRPPPPSVSRVAAESPRPTVRRT